MKLIVISHNFANPPKHTIVHIFGTVYKKNHTKKQANILTSSIIRICNIYPLHKKIKPTVLKDSDCTAH